MRTVIVAVAAVVLLLAGCEELPEKPKPKTDTVRPSDGEQEFPEGLIWSEENCPDVETKGEIAVVFTYLDTPIQTPTTHHGGVPSSPLVESPLLGGMKALQFVIRNIGSVPVYVHTALAFQSDGLGLSLYEYSTEEEHLAYSSKPTGNYILKPGEEISPWAIRLLLLRQTDRVFDLNDISINEDGDYAYFGEFKLIISWADYIPEGKIPDGIGVLPGIGELETDKALDQCSGLHALINTTENYATEIAEDQELAALISTIVWDDIPPSSISFWRFYEKNSMTVIQDFGPDSTFALRVGRRAGEVTSYGLSSPGSPAVLDLQAGPFAGDHADPVDPVDTGGILRPSSYYVDCSKGIAGVLKRQYFDDLHGAGNYYWNQWGLETRYGLSGCGLIGVGGVPNTNMPARHQGQLAPATGR